MAATCRAASIPAHPFIPSRSTVVERFKFAPVILQHEFRQPPDIYCRLPGRFLVEFVGI